MKKKKIGRPAIPGRVPVSVRLPEELWRRVEAWRGSREASAGARISQSAAVEAIIERGLKA